MVNHSSYSKFITDNFLFCLKKNYWHLNACICWTSSYPVGICGAGPWLSGFRFIIWIEEFTYGYSTLHNPPIHEVI